MRIGILTLPFNNNYGGILQCYALCAFLKKMGHDPVVIRREENRQPLLKRLIYKVRWLFLKKSNMVQLVDRTKYIRPFAEKRLDRTNLIRSEHQMYKVCEKYKLDAVIVGSDQVWRTDYAMRFGYNYFLDYVPNNIKKLSYAASLGLNDWLYDQKQTKRIGQLLSTFNGVSVREKEAVTLLKEHIGIDAEWHIDPTMLLVQDEYNMIVSSCKEHERYVFVYWLGEKTLVAKDIQEYKQKGYKVIDINLRDEREQESIEDWLSYIKYAECIITDSFHGCVFSILFERPFIVRFNESGGVGRLESLFELLKIDINNKTIVMPDYCAVKACIDSLRARSSAYLKMALE